MFKLSVITDEISQDLEKAAELAKEFKLHGVEIRSVWEKGPQELEDSDIDKIKSILADSGLKVCSIASPFFKCDLDNEDEYQQHIQILRKCIELAKIFGANVVRGFAFWRKEGLEPDWDRILKKFEEPVEILESESVILGLENEASTWITNASKLVSFLDRLGSEKVKAVWDPGNDLYDPDKEKPYPDGYNIVKDYMVHVHIKDVKVSPEMGKPEPAVIGKGDVNYLEQLRALKEDGYEGYVSLETHYRPKVKLPEEIVQAPKGAQFSYLGEQGSRECLVALWKILQEIGYTP